MAATPFKAGPEGVAVSLRVTPRAARDRIDGLAATADDGAELKVGVTAAPEDGKANAAVLKLLAKAWKLPKSSLSVVRGQGERHKTVLVAGDSTTLEPTLRHWLERL